MLRSDIFSEFVKVAREKGLVSEPAHAEHTEKDFHETNVRYDSLSIEQISKLYNNKNKSPKEMEYKKNIMEIAHPAMAVLFPSYDKLNGLVENENEGQNIRIHISLKDPDGQLVQRKYAEEQLIMSLVRVANDLDNRNQEKLCKLADVCLSQATRLNKTALAPLAPIVGVAIVVGAIWMQQHSNFNVDGWAADYQKTIAEIDDLTNASSSVQSKLGAGYEYTPALIETVTELKSKLAEINVVVQQAYPIIENMQKPRDRDDLLRQAQASDTNEAAQAISQLRQVMSKNLPFIRQTMSDFSNPSFKQKAIQNKGVFMSLLDKTQILHGDHGLVADDFDDVVRALNANKQDLINIVKDLKNFSSAKQAAQNQLEQSDSETSQIAGPGNEQTPGPMAGLEERAKGILGLGK